MKIIIDIPVDNAIYKRAPFVLFFMNYLRKIIKFLTIGTIKSTILYRYLLRI